MRWFVNLSLLKKILIVSFVMLASAITWGAFNSYMAYVVMKDDMQEKNMYLVQTVHSMVDGMRHEVESGKMTREEAQESAKQILRKARYEGGKQYFWINGFDGQVVMHPILPELESQDISKTKKNVYDLFTNFANAVKGHPDGIGYDYKWSKPNHDPSVLYPKSSYIIGIEEWGWVIGTGAYLDELQDKALKLFFFEMGFVAIFAMVLLIGAYLSVRVLSKPLQQLARNMEGLASGDLGVDVPHRNRMDEVGMIAKAFAVFKDNAIEKKNLEDRQVILQQKAEADRKNALMELADSFEGRTSGVIKTLLAAADDLNKSAQGMKASSNENVDTSRAVAEAITNANQNVQTVAAASEELTASSQEIARQISGVAEKSNRSSNEAESTNEEISRLNELANSIGDVVSSIKGIADQTNLLALNATIEAARAGEAGKGFAVVADEVKKLATETAQKTMEIDERVVVIQEAVRNTVEAVGRILKDVKDIDQATSTVASAVEQQNAATAEIGRNVNEASNGTNQVSDGINHVLEKSIETGKSADLVLKSSEELATVSNRLRSEVNDFLQGIRK